MTFKEWWLSDTKNHEKTFIQLFEEYSKMKAEEAVANAEAEILIQSNATSFGELFGKTKFRDEYIARRAAEYMVENALGWIDGVVDKPEAVEHIQLAIQHAISEG
jgi:hypothetical protein